MIEIKNINKYYGNLKVIDNLSIKMKKGKVYCIFGSSGCGKTSFLNSIIDRENVRSKRVVGLEEDRISYVFQEDRLVPWLTVEENLELVLESEKDRQERKVLIEEILEKINMKDFKSFFPSGLSGGMKQKISIARALIYGGELLILDEPFKGLDLNIKNKIMRLIRSKWLEISGLIIFVTHNIDEAVDFSDEILIVEGLPFSIVRSINVKEFIGRKEELKKILREI